MNAQSFSVVPGNERTKAFATLLSAFTDDPFERWMYPDLQDYLTHFPRFLAAFGGNAFDQDTVWTLGDFAAVALWLPPEVGPDEDAIVSVLRETLLPEHEDTFTLLEKMDEVHPKYRHWYLPWFGVHAGSQGQGLGSQLMDHCLKLVDQSHLPAYLESPNPRNVSFYERHGFVVTGVAEVGACPPIVFMLREAQ